MYIKNVRLFIKYIYPNVRWQQIKTENVWQVYFRVGSFGLLKEEEEERCKKSFVLTGCLQSRAYRYASMWTRCSPVAEHNTDGLGYKWKPQKVSVGHMADVNLSTSIRQIAVTFGPDIQPFNDHLKTVKPVKYLNL